MPAIQGSTAAAGGGAGVTDGDKGAVVVSGDGAVWSIDESGMAAIAADPALTDAFAALSYGTFVRRVRQTLTGKTSFAGTTAEQWGTEEAVLDDAVLPKLTEVTVSAQVVGYISDQNTTSPLNISVEISLDGGATWDTGLSARHRRHTAGGANDDQPIAASHQVAGSVTGDIQARVMATSSQGAADPRNLSGGAIYMEVLVSQVPLA